MTDKPSDQEIYHRAVINSLAQQRSTTADELAHALGLLAVANATITELRKQLADSQQPTSTA